MLPGLKAMGLSPKKLTLELLENEKPQEFEMGEDGLMVCMNGWCEKVNVSDVEKAIVELATCIEHDYEK